MILKTKEFSEICKTISLAVSEQAANLELKTEDTNLYLNITNKEYYVSVRFELSEPVEFHATVDANLFLSLVAGLTTETFELTTNTNKVVIKAGKSKYTAPIIYENDAVMNLPVISLANPTVEMNISKDILQSILTVNSKELLKTKNLDVSELQKLYYITQEGCFTFTTGACLNAFTLEKPVAMLLNETIVKLFKLFNEDTSFKMSHDQTLAGKADTRISFSTNNVCLTAYITNDDLLLSKVQGPCLATKQFISENYLNKLVLSTNTLKSAINRLMLFTKNSVSGVNMLSIPATFAISNSELVISDKQENSEVIAIENGSFVDSDYEMVLNLADLKLVLDSCTCDHITLNCGNHRSVVVTRGNISNLIPEGVRA